MSIKPYRFEVSEARSVKHPTLPNILKHTFLVPAHLFPKGVPSGANLRDPVGMNRQVYKDVKASLEGKEALPGTFDLLNLGITIIAEDVKVIDKRVFDVMIDDEYGIANGSHTTQIIYDCQDDDSIAEGQHVEVKIITGLEGGDNHSLRVDIARGQNTGISVQPRSIFELDGAFNSIKAIVVDEDWADDIGYKESDKKDIDVRELVAVLELLNVVDFPIRDTKHPIPAYEKWSTPLNKFGDDYKLNRATPDNRKYAIFEPLLLEALELYDHIRRDFLRVYNETVGGRAGNLRIVEKAPASKGRFKFPYAKLDEHEQRLTKGAAYPILGAFRNFVKINEETGMAEWQGGFENVLNSWRDLAPELVAETKQAIKDIGNAPDSLGKNRNHWANLFKTVRLHVMEQQLDAMG
ncbi:AIPR family protein [uncultured Shimia sp.]|uniref:AIPR family protein n=1 Tax=uncultured Shimia sp. TaxID=573152 RepID=UPI0026111510|nr:AIPR family protein [uncultured Shimia sp.]